MSHVTATGSRLACFAVAPPGLESLVAEELRTLQRIHPLTLDAPELGGVSFLTDMPGLYGANLHLRIASRVLVRIGSFHAASFHELERHAARLPWGAFAPSGRAVDFRVTSR